MTAKLEDAMTSIRIPRRIRDIIGRAAAIQGRSDADFLVAVLSEAAHKVIADDTLIRLSLADQEALADALLDGKPHPAPRRLGRLRRAVRDHAACVESV